MAYTYPITNVKGEMENPNNSTEENKKDTEKDDEEKEKRLVANVTVGLAFPIDGDWDEIGPHLHAVRGVMHRCLNASISAVAVQDAVTKTTNYTGDKWGHAAYAAIENRLKDDQEYYSQKLKHLIDGTLPPKPKKDTDEKDGKKRRPPKPFAERVVILTEKIKRAQKKLDKKPGDVEAQKGLENAENALRKLENEKTYLEAKANMGALGSNIKDAIARKAVKAYKVYLKESLAGTRSLPTYNNNSPIFLRDGDGSWTLHREKKYYVLSVKVHPGRTGKVRFALKHVDGSAHSHLKKMMDKEAIESGEVKLGDMKLIWHPKKKWLAQLCYSWPKPEPKKINMKCIVAIKRGLRHFMLMAATGANPDIRPWIDGGDIIAVTRQFDARTDGLYRNNESILAKKREFMEVMESLQRHSRELGSAGRKHGKTRREQRITKLRHKERNWIMTKCQRAAAALIAFCIKHGAGLIVIESWGTPLNEHQLSLIENERLRALMARFPYYLLKSCIIWAAKKAGITVVEVSMKDTYHTCPKCGYKDEIQYNMSTKMFKCLNPRCKTERAIEQASIWHMLKRAGGKGVDKSMKKADERVRALLNEEVSNAIANYSEKVREHKSDIMEPTVGGPDA